MSRIEAFAPGKLLLIGEYAVLDGAPALVMSVDRRVKVRIEPAADGPGRLNAPQLGIRRASMRVDRDRLRCDGPDSGALGLTGKLIPAILRALGRAPDEVTMMDIEIDSGELFESNAHRPVKLGLGSSAAVCAALAIGLSRWYEDPAAVSPPGELLSRWLPVYRDALNARASGADLAAAFCGGFSRFRSSAEGVDCLSRSWPKTLHWQAVWTRRAAQTTDFVGAFDAWKRRDPRGAAEILARLNTIVQGVSENPVDSDGLFEACGAYADQMLALGHAAGMEIMTLPHRRLAEYGRQCGVVYKTCGAGGGDLGIALARDRDQLHAFRTGVSDCGGVPLNLAISDSGAGHVSRGVPETGEKKFYKE